MHPSMRFVLIVVLAILLVVLLPTWPYSEPWGIGYWPSGLVGLVLLVVLVMAGLSTRAGPL
jgi:hypothetical protein